VAQKREISQLLWIEKAQFAKVNARFITFEAKGVKRRAEPGLLASQ
jgi:hypothetical protein